jgi:hypothetical protein
MSILLRLCGPPILLGMLSLRLALAADGDPGRIAIIDASERIIEHLQDFKRAGVLVIGRYLARCRQWNGKRIIDNKDELKGILDEGFGVLSVYQYHNDSALKFAGRASRVYKRVYTLNEDPDGVLAKARETECPIAAWPTNRQRRNEYEIEVSQPGRDCQLPTVRNCQGIEPNHTGIAEAEWDAEAAVAQAYEIDQPAETAVYFGVDFDAVLRNNPALKQQLIDYFTVVSNKLRGDPKHYLIGAYGNGAALELLVETKVGEGPFKGRSLVDLTWFSASPGHDRTTIVYNGDVDAKFDWDLMQSRVAIDYPSPSKGMPVDLDIQNKKNAGKYIGFWKRSGKYQVPEARTVAIFDQRRFTCNGMALILSKPGGDAVEGLFCGRKSDNERRTPQYDCNDGVFPTDKRSRICFGAVTRVGAESGGFVSVDCDEDGTFEGWTSSQNLTRTMAKRPKWVGKMERRRMMGDRATCE